MRAVVVTVCCLVAAVAGPGRTGPDRNADDLLHRHRRRAVDALRRSRPASRCWWIPATPATATRAHRRDAAHRGRHEDRSPVDHALPRRSRRRAARSSRSSSPSAHFYDHGKPHPNDRIVSSQFLSAYESLSAGKRTIVKPGDKVKMTGLDITAVASANQFIRTNLPGGGAQNASCAGVQQKDESAYPDPDNGESAGFVLTYGRFRTIDLGDLRGTASSI